MNCSYLNFLHNIQTLRMYPGSPLEDRKYTINSYVVNLDAFIEVVVFTIFPFLLCVLYSTAQNLQLKTANRGDSEDLRMRTTVDIGGSLCAGESTTDPNSITCEVDDCGPFQGTLSFKWTADDQTNDIGSGDAKFSVMVNDTGCISTLTVLDAEVATDVTCTVNSTISGQRASATSFIFPHRGKLVSFHDMLAHCQAYFFLPQDFHVKVVFFSY